MPTLKRCMRKAIIATEYMGIPTRVGTEIPGDEASLIWTLRHSFVNLGHLNRELIQLGYEPTEVDICSTIDVKGPHLFVMVDCAR